MPRRCECFVDMVCTFFVSAVGSSLLIGYRVSVGVVHPCISAFTEVLIRPMFFSLEVRGYKKGCWAQTSLVSKKQSCKILIVLMCLESHQISNIKLNYMAVVVAFPYWEMIMFLQKMSNMRKLPDYKNNCLVLFLVGTCIQCDVINCCWYDFVANSCQM